MSPRRRSVAGQPPYAEPCCTALVVATPVAGAQQGTAEARPHVGGRAQPEVDAEAPLPKVDPAATPVQSRAESSPSVQRKSAQARAPPAAFIRPRCRCGGARLCDICDEPCAQIARAAATGAQDAASLIHQQAPVQVPKSQRLVLASAL